MDIKKLSAVDCAAILVLILGACGDASASSDKNHSTGHASVAKIAGEKFTVGFDPNFPPYGYRDERTDEYAGFDVDLVKEVVKRSEWKFVSQSIDRGMKDMELNSGTMGCLQNGFTINGRENKYIWSKPYVDNSTMFAMKTADKIIDTKSLADRRVLMQAGSFGLTALESKDNKDFKDSFASLDQVPDYNQAFTSMESGAVDAIAVNVEVANSQAQAREEGKFTVTNPSFYVEQYGIGFKKSSESLRSQVQRVLDKIKADGTFMKLAEKHMVEEPAIRN